MKVGERTENEDETFDSLCWRTTIQGHTVTLTVGIKGQQAFRCAFIHVHPYEGGLTENLHGLFTSLTMLYGGDAEVTEAVKGDVRKELADICQAGFAIAIFDWAVEIIEGYPRSRRRSTKSNPARPAGTR